MAKIKKLLAVLVCAAMALAGVPGLTVCAEEYDEYPGLEEALKDQKENHPEDFDQNGVRKAREFIFKNASYECRRTMFEDEVPGMNSDPVKFLYDVDFEEYYGMLILEVEGSEIIVPVVREGSKMHVHFTQNGQWVKPPIFCDEVVRNENGLGWHIDEDNDGNYEFQGGFLSIREVLAPYKGEIDFAGWQSNADEVKDLEIGAEGEDKYWFKISSGLNKYLLDSVYLWNGHINWDEIPVGTVLAVNDEQIEEFRETGIMNFPNSADWRDDAYSWTYDGLYEMLFGKGLPLPQIIEPHEYITKADVEYCENLETGIYDRRVDHNIELTFDGCYGVIQMDAASRTMERDGTVVAERAGIDPIIEIPVVKAGSKMDVKLLNEVNTNYDGVWDFSLSYSPEALKDDGGPVTSAAMAYFYYGAYYDDNGKLAISYSHGGEVTEGDMGNRFNYISEREIEYKMLPGTIDYLAAMGWDIMSFLTMKFVIALTDSQIIELYNNKTITDLESGETVAIPGLYEAVFGSDLPAPEIGTPEITVSGGTLSITVAAENVPETAELIAISYGTDGGLVDIAPVENGEATLTGEGAKTVKVFCWESLESMRPLCEAKVVEVTQ